MKKKLKEGLIIGKFYPFHNGHKYLIETGLKNCQTLTVIICQTDRYKIPVEIRAGWIKESFPSVDVRILHHEAALDSNSTDVSEIWAKLTVKYLGFIPDVVFSSETYGAPYAGFMGSKHMLVDLDRKYIPISASMIRSDIRKYWDFLPEVTRKYFTKRIVVIGAESTGTTTLARELAAHYHTPWVPEYGRLYYEGKMTSDKLNSWSTSEFVHIAISQNHLEDALAGQSNGLLICDTDAFATSLWHERYVGKKSKEVDSVINTTKPTLYLLTDIDIPFVQDGTRDGENIRTWMHNEFVKKLQTTKRNFVIISGSREKRLSDAISAVDQALTDLAFPKLYKVPPLAKIKPFQFPEFRPEMLVHVG